MLSYVSDPRKQDRGNDRRSKLIDIPQPKTYVLDKSGLPVHEPNMVKFGAFLASDAKCLKQDMLPD
jgi:hypothetical protein